MKTTKILIGLEHADQIKKAMQDEKWENVEFMTPLEVIQWGRKFLYSDSQRWIVVVGNKAGLPIAQQMNAKKSKGMEVEIVRYSVHPLDSDENKNEEKKKLFDLHLTRTNDDHITLIEFLHSRTGREKHEIALLTTKIPLLEAAGH